MAAIKSNSNFDGGTGQRVGLEVVDAELDNTQKAGNNTDSFDDTSHCESVRVVEFEE